MRASLTRRLIHPHLSCHAGSLLITDDFIRAVREEGDWPLIHPVLQSEADEVDLSDESQVVWRDWPSTKD